MVHKNTWLVLRKESQDMRASQHVCYVNETLWSTESKETRSRTARVHMSIHASIECSFKKLLWQCKHSILAFSVHSLNLKHACMLSTKISIQRDI